MLRSRTRLAAVLAAAALLLAACGGGDSDAGSGAAAPSELKVFAAASLTAAFTELGRRYAAANGGDKVIFNFAGSQALATQLGQGAPADVFASADTTNLDKVKDLVGTPRSFASNRLQIVVEQGNPRHVTGLEDLAGRDLKVVLAAPDVPAAGTPGRPSTGPGCACSRCRRRTTSRRWSPRCRWARPTPGSSTSPT